MVFELVEVRVPLRFPPRGLIKGPSALTNIPPEVLVQIFVVYFDSLASQKVHDARQILRLTCKEWRACVDETAEIWAFLDIRVGNRAPASLLGMVQAWLSRSSRFPLRISLTVEGYGPVVPSLGGRLANHILKTLFRHVDRWRTVSFSFGLDPFDTLPSIKEEGVIAPLLEGFEIRSSSYIATSQYQWMGQLLRQSPRLRTFIDSIPPTRDAAYMDYIPFPRLSVLKMNKPLRDSLALRLIEEMPVLEICHISLEYDGGWTTSIPDSNHSITCFVTELKVTVRGDGKKFFGPLLTPNLLSFELHLTPERPMQKKGEYMAWDFLRKISSTLTSFTIRNLFMIDDDLLGCLEILSPNLKTLRILTDGLSTLELYKIENFTGKVISALAGDEDSFENPRAPLCPRLEALVLQRCVAADDGLLANMISERWRIYQAISTNPGPSPTISGLFLFDVVFRYHSHQVDRDALHALRRQGLAGRTIFGLPSFR